MNHPEYLYTGPRARTCNTRQKLWVFVTLCLYLNLGQPFPAAAQESSGQQTTQSGASTSASQKPKLPAANRENFQAFLLTLSTGNTLYSQAGHSLLRVIDTRTGKKRDQFYNWGTFDIEADMFALSFYRGTLKYSLQISPARRYLKWFSRFKERSILQQKIFLSDRQTEKLATELARISKVENRFYPYHLWKNNCATKIRDLLDVALDGQLALTQKEKFYGKSLREFWHQYFIRWPVTNFAADLVYNGEVDHNVSLWEGNYAPMLLKSSLESFSHGPGDEMAGKPLLGQPRSLQKGRDLPLPLLEGRFLFLLKGLVMLLLIGWVSYRSAKLANLSRFELVLSGLTLMTWGLFSGTFGLLHIVNPVFTLRTYFHFSASFYMLWPTDFALCYLGFKLLGAGKFASPSAKTQKFFKWLAISHLVSYLCLLTVWAVGGMRQNPASILTGISLQTLSVFGFTLYLCTRGREIWNRSPRMEDGTDQEPTTSENNRADSKKKKRKKKKVA